MNKTEAEGSAGGSPEDELELSIETEGTGDLVSVTLRGEQATVVRGVIGHMSREILRLKLRLSEEGVEDDAEGGHGTWDRGKTLT